MVSDPNGILDNLVLAIITGGLFGVLLSLFENSWRRTLAALTLLVIMQSLPQQLYRSLEIEERPFLSEELVYVLTLRIAFLASAVLILAIANRRRRCT